jgi:hypothetical protein
MTNFRKNFGRLNLCTTDGSDGLIDDEQETIKPPSVASGCVKLGCTTNYKR